MVKIWPFFYSLLGSFTCRACTAFHLLILEHIRGRWLSWYCPQMSTHSRKCSSRQCPRTSLSSQVVCNHHFCVYCRFWKILWALSLLCVLVCPLSRPSGTVCDTWMLPLFLFSSLYTTNIFLYPNQRLQLHKWNRVELINFACCNYRKTSAQWLLNIFILNYCTCIRNHSYHPKITQ